jgi:hypothetical protein
MLDLRFSWMDMTIITMTKIALSSFIATLLDVRCIGSSAKQYQAELLASHVG